MLTFSLLLPVAVSCRVGVQPETVELIGLSQEYPLRVYDTPWKLFEAPDKKHGSQQLLNLALYKQ